MDFLIPSNFSLTYSAEQIAQRAAELGAQVGQWAAEVQKNTKADVLAVPVLRGAMFFFSDLVRKMGTSVEVAAVRTWGYDPAGNRISETLRVSLDDVAVRRRSILLIDDICDSGRSLAAVSNAFLDAGAHEVKSVVLIRRVIQDPAHVPDWAGFEYAHDLWFVGYGMDDCDRWRNLPDVYVIKQGNS